MAKRKALGKGLSALIPDAQELDAREGQFFQCPIEAIKPNPSQPRQDISDAELEELVNSVREKGVITPLLVSGTEGGYQLIAGERRWRAAQKAGLERVPVVVRDVTPSESLEEAFAYRRLLEETGATQDLLAKRLGKDRSSITNLLRLLKLPVFIQQDLIDGRLSMGHARVLVGLEVGEEQRALRDTIVKKRLSVRQSEALAKRRRSQAHAKKKESDLDYYLQSLADNLKRSLGTKIDIKKKGGGGRIIIHFYSDDELDRLLDLLG
jgi:ParB family chromosome partitioning protein